MSAQRWLLLIAVTTTVVLLAASAFGPYGYFIDEFYYLACARRPALGYVDHPPLSPLILTAVRAVLGESLLAIRLVPALAAGATVYVTGLLAREWGGARFAMCLAALGMAAAPMLMVMGSYYSMNSIELLVWALVMLLVSRIANGQSPRLWLAVGVLIGAGFLLKHTIVLLVFGLAVGTLLTPLRRHLLTPWPWLGAALALVLALPNIGWQIANDWPTLEFYRQATAHKNIPTSPLGALVNQALVLHPLLIALWGAGAIALIVSPRLRQARFAGLCWWALLVLMVVSRSSRPDRIAGLGAALFAGGGVAWEGWIRSARGRAACFGFVVLAAALLAPLNLPLLSFAATAKFAAASGVVPKIERGKTSPLPQWLADRTGWESMLEDVTAVVDSLPPDQRAHALILAPDYGTAGALELWGPARGLPRVISTQNSFYHWSQGHTDSEVLIAIGVDADRLRERFVDVRVAGGISCFYCMSWRSDRSILVARQPVVPLSQVWAQMKHYE